MVHSSGSASEVGICGGKGKKQLQVIVHGIWSPNWDVHLAFKILLGYASGFGMSQVDVHFGRKHLSGIFIRDIWMRAWCTKVQLGIRGVGLEYPWNVPAQ